MNQARLNINPTNYFTGSVYADRLKTKEDVVQWFERQERVCQLWYQLERGKDGNLHWQYTFKTSGKQQRYSFWWKALGFKKGEWIDGALKVDACLNYVKKAGTRVEGPYEWIRTPWVPFVPSHDLGDSKNLAGLLSNKIAEMRRWQEWMDKNPVVNDI